MSTPPTELPYRTPVNVSPLIKLSRWTLLISGIAWGIHRQRVNQRKEDEYRAYIEKMKPIWMENKRKVMAKRNREGLLTLAKDVGQPIPPNFDELYPDPDLEKPKA